MGGTVAKSKQTKSTPRSRTAKRAAGSGSLKGAHGSRGPGGPKGARGEAPSFGREVAGRFKETKGREWRRTTMYLLALAVFVLFAVSFVAPRRGGAVAVLLAVAFIWTMLAVNSRTFAYRCAKCKTVFQVPIFVNFFTMTWRGRRPDGISYSYKNLTCPHCHTRTRAAIVSRVDAERERAKRRGGKEPRLLG